MKFRKISMVALFAATSLTLAACASDTNSGTAPTSGGGAAPSAASSTPAESGTSAGGSASAVPAGESKVLTDAAAGKLTVGIKYDQPGLGVKNADGTFSGFDVDVATYVAGKLGVEPAGITFVETKSSEREDKIAKGEVDFIVATYSITDARKEIVNFAGPYFVAHQDLLVAAADTAITGPEALNGKILCSVTGSTPAQKVKDNYAAEVALQEFGTYSECVEQLKAGVVDAVTTDDVILAGFAAGEPDAFKLVGKGFSDENYGIGLLKGDTEGTDKINQAIEDMISDGSWKAALEKNVGPSGYTIPEPPTPGEVATPSSGASSSSGAGGSSSAPSSAAPTS